MPRLGRKPNEPQPGTEVATPDLGGNGPTQTPPPKAPEAWSPPFYIMVHPHRWGVIAGRIVPIVRRFKGTPGANGVDRDGKGRPVMNKAIAEQGEQGWICIPWDVDGPGTHYLRRVIATGGWIDRWTTVYPGATEVTFDRAGFAEWLDGLIERGIVPRCPLFVLLRLRAVALAGVAKLRKHGDVYASQIEIRERDLATLEAAILEAGGQLDIDVDSPAATEEATPTLGTAEPKKRVRRRKADEPEAPAETETAPPPPDPDAA
jgi:hypothetical protein